MTLKERAIARQQVLDDAVAAIDVHRHPSDTFDYTLVMFGVPDRPAPVTIDDQPGDDA
jgi:hypothetical protein